MPDLDWDALRPDDLSQPMRELYERAAEDDPALASRAIQWAVEAFGGGNVYVPSLDHVARRQRQERLTSDLREGLPVAEVAERHGLSRRRVREMRQEMREGEAAAV